MRRISGTDTGDSSKNTENKKNIPKIKGCVCMFFCLDAHFIHGMAVCNGFVCAWLADPFSYIIVISPDSVDGTQYNAFCTDCQF